MRCVAAIAVAMLLAGCGEGNPPGAYRDVRDRVVASIGVPILGRGPCWRAQNDETFEPDKSLTEICYRFTKQQRWHGLWRNDFEGSRFCPAPAAQCSYETSGDKVWLDFSFGVTDTKPRKWKVQPGGLYDVDFIGRKTEVKGHYGHMGMSDHALILDRMISMREVEPPPKN